MESLNSELNMVFNLIDMSEPTRKSHLLTFKKIQSLVVIDQPIHSIELDVIESIINTPEVSPSYRAKIISLFIIVKRAFKQPDADLTKLGNMLNENKQSLKDKRLADFKTEDTNLYNNIETYINQIDYEADPIRFIVNYIVFYLNVRNMDLICKVIEFDTQHLEPTDAKMNYLIVYKTHIVYKRNYYKTVGTYKEKVNHITDPRFIVACERLLPLHMPMLLMPTMDIVPTLLLPTTDNTNRIEDFIGKAVARKLYKHNGTQLTETKYLHNCITHYKNDVNKLFEIEENRGTNIRVLLTNYNSAFSGLSAKKL